MKILKRILISLFVLVALIVGIVVTVWLKPEIVLTEARVKSLLDLAPVKFRTKPEHVKLQLLPFTFFGKDVRLEISEFCLVEPESCFGETKIQFQFKITKLIHAKLEKLGPISVENKFLKIVPVADPVPSPTPGSPSTFELSEYLSLAPDFKIEDIAIHAPLIEIGDPKKPDRIAVAVDAHDRKSLLIDGRYQQAAGLKANAKIESSFETLGRSPLKISASVEEGWKAKADLTGDFLWENLGVKLSGEISAKDLIPFVETLTVHVREFKRDPNLSLKADIDASLEPRLVATNSKSVLPRAKFDLGIHGKIEATQDGDRIPYDISLGPIEQKGLKIEAIAQGEFPIKLKKFFFEFSIPEFQTLVASLRKTNSAIPAPFHSLKGPIALKIGKRNEFISATKTESTLPIELSTALNASAQEIRTLSRGTLKFTPDFQHFDLEGSSDIEKLRLTLPQFDILATDVAYRKDPRIIVGKDQGRKAEIALREARRLPIEAQTKNAASDVFQYHWNVRSGEGAIQVFYPMLKPYAPLTFSMELSSDQTAGELKVLPFTVHYMNREARVENFHYLLNPTDRSSLYGGRMTVKKTDYTITIDVYDNAGKAKITLKSDPPLAESDIVSVLLFNQTSAELSPDESNSVTDTQAAIANRALGLFSIWALSATPVEAVSYDPGTHVYSARVRLADGLTATVGTNWDSTQEVALRKRIGRNFFLSTIFTADRDPVNGDRDTKKALLNWFKRY